MRVSDLGLPSQDVHKVCEAVRPGRQGRLKVDRRQGGRRKLLDAVYVEYLFLGNSGKCFFYMHGIRLSVFSPDFRYLLLPPLHLRIRIHIPLHQRRFRPSSFMQKRSKHVFEAYFGFLF